MADREDRTDEVLSAISALADRINNLEAKVDRVDARAGTLDRIEGRIAKMEAIVSGIARQLLPSSQCVALGIPDARSTGKVDVAPAMPARAAKSRG